jgi:hypothetical protein
VGIGVEEASGAGWLVAMAGLIMAVIAFVGSFSGSVRRDIAAQLIPARKTVKNIVSFKNLIVFEQPSD